MTIKEVSERYDIPSNTIRYYERIGVIPPVSRQDNGIRNFDEESCRWVEFAKCMRSSGVQIEALIEYVALYFQKGTEKARKDILVEQRERLKQNYYQLIETMKRLDRKIANFKAESRY